MQTWKYNVNWLHSSAKIYPEECEVAPAKNAESQIHS